MAKDLQCVLLLDCYGDLLTERQRELAELYYNEDLTLSEIADLQHISRQAVLDSLQHSEQMLRNAEEKLGMAQRIGKLRHCLESILAAAQEQPDTETIRTLAQQGLELL